MVLARLLQLVHHRTERMRMTNRSAGLFSGVLQTQAAYPQLQNC